MINIYEKLNDIKQRADASEVCVIVRDEGLIIRCIYPDGMGFSHLFSRLEVKYRDIDDYFIQAAGRFMQKAEELKGEHNENRQNTQTDHSKNMGQEIAKEEKEKLCF